jgi:hypothetical protein
MAQCKACNAEIKWIRMKSGKQMPVDPKPIVVVTDLGTMVRGYNPHWASCPAAENFRKGGSSA